MVQIGDDFYEILINIGWEVLEIEYGLRLYLEFIHQKIVFLKR